MAGTDWRFRIHHDGYDLAFAADCVHGSAQKPPRSAPIPAPDLDHAHDPSGECELLKRSRSKIESMSKSETLRVSFLLPTSNFLLTFPPYALHRPHAAGRRQDFEIPG